MEPVDLFYSYAHEDEPLRDELAQHLNIMQRQARYELALREGAFGEAVMPGELLELMVNFGLH